MFYSDMENNNQKWRTLSAKKKNNNNTLMYTGTLSQQPFYIHCKIQK